MSLQFFSIITFFIILISLLILLLGNVQQRNMKHEIYNREKCNNHTNDWKLLITLLIARRNMSVSVLTSIEIEVGTIPKFVVMFEYYWNLTQSYLP